jgi:putative SOS response-associated peptidase YedK
MTLAERSGGSSRNVDMAWIQGPPLRCVLEFLHCFEDRKHKIADRSFSYPAYGFYESRREGKGKVSMPIVTQDHQLFTYAGLWDMWRDQEGSDLYTFTIITTNANELLRPIDHRKPVIIDSLATSKWLDPVVSIQEHSILLQPLPSALMGAYEISRLVNDLRNDSPPASRRRFANSGTVL